MPGIMSVSYDIEQEGKAGYNVRDTACFSGMFYDNHRHDTKIKVWFWHEGNKEQIIAADRYINEFVIPNIPNRMAGMYNFHKEKPYFSLRNGAATFWQGLEIDLTKSNATDLFILLTLARYPQENPRHATSMFALADAGENLGTAFILSHNACDVGSGHLLIDLKVKYYIAAGGKLTKNFNLKSIWTHKVLKTLEEYPKKCEESRVLEGYEPMPENKWKRYTKPYCEEPHKYSPINTLFNPV